MNRIQSNYHRIGTYEIDKISLSYFYDKIYIQNNSYDGLLLVIRVNYEKSFFVKLKVLFQSSF